ncbi:MAG: hypothetical protein ABGY09_05900 [Euryarchaeota archaeon]
MTGRWVMLPAVMVLLTLTTLLASSPGRADVYAIALKCRPLLRIEPGLGWAAELSLNGQSYRVILVEDGRVRWRVKERLGGEVRGWMDVDVRAPKNAPPVRVRVFSGFDGRYLRLYGLVLSGVSELKDFEMSLLEVRNGMERRVVRIRDCVVVHRLTRDVTRLPVNLSVSVLPREGVVGERLIVCGELRDVVFGVPVTDGLTISFKGCGLDRSVSVHPDASGWFRTSVKVEEPGMLTVEVKFDGGDLYQSASKQVTCTFLERARLRLIAVSDGDRAFKLQAVLTDYRGTPIPNARILLLENYSILSNRAVSEWVTGPDGKTPPLLVVPKRPGRFVYVAMFPGGSLVTPSFSNPVTVVVETVRVRARAAAKGARGGGEKPQNLPCVPVIPLRPRSRRPEAA